jgi:hypothetical protein
LAGRTIWNVNSTATGGGVAEMLQVLVGYVSDLDIPIGWLVVTGDAEFSRSPNACTIRSTLTVRAGPWARSGGPSLHTDAYR